MTPERLGMGEPAAAPPPVRRSGPAGCAAPVGFELFSLINADLLIVEQILADELRSAEPYVRELVEYTWRWGGKRLRPALVLLSAQACGAIKQEHRVLAAVVEMIHTATLVHDDVLDGAGIRRHFATVNARWGTEASVLFGDFLFTHAFHLAASLDSTFACREIGRATNIVCEGELRQIHERGNLELDENEYLDIIRCKTAELCSVCCRLGAHYAGAPGDVESGMERYGRQLGIAFQIADDILDYLGDECETGKSLGTDLAQAKPTLPLIRLLKYSPPATAHAVRTLLQSPPAANREALRLLLDSSDAMTYTRQRALEFAAGAKQELGRLPESPAKAVLGKLTDVAVSRRS